MTLDSGSKAMKNQNVKKLKTGARRRARQAAARSAKTSASERRTLQSQRDGDQPKPG